MDKYVVCLKRVALVAAMLGAGLAGLPALAASTGATPGAGYLAAARARYEQERAGCVSGKSNQDVPTCLKEAGAAYAEARRGGLGDMQSSYQANALVRCERLAGDDRRDCVSRITGQGTTSGSVASGGIYRELVTREIATPAPTIAASAPVSR